jgi:hypothetical protein
MFKPHFYVTFCIELLATPRIKVVLYFATGVLPASDAVRALVKLNGANTASPVLSECSDVTVAWLPTLPSLEAP